MISFAHLVTAVGMRPGQWAIDLATNDAYLRPWRAAWSVRVHEGRPTGTRLLLDHSVPSSGRVRCRKVDQEREVDTIAILCTVVQNTTTRKLRCTHMSTNRIDTVTQHMHLHRMQTQRVRRAIQSVSIAAHRPKTPWDVRTSLR